MKFVVGKFGQRKVKEEGGYAPVRRRMPISFEVFALPHLEMLPAHFDFQ